MLSVEDWAEIRRLHRAERVPIKVIARTLGVSRNTVRSALVACHEHGTGLTGFRVAFPPRSSQWRPRRFRKRNRYRRRDYRSSGF